jgi:hypothetical protein
MPSFVQRVVVTFGAGLDGLLKTKTEEPGADITRLFLARTASLRAGWRRDPSCFGLHAVGERHSKAAVPRWSPHIPGMLVRHDFGSHL